MTDKPPQPGLLVKEPHLGGRGKAPTETASSATQRVPSVHASFRYRTVHRARLHSRLSKDSKTHTPGWSVGLVLGHLSPQAARWALASLCPAGPSAHGRRKGKALKKGVHPPRRFWSALFCSGEQKCAAVACLTLNGDDLGFLQWD